MAKKRRNLVKLTGEEGSSYFLVRRKPYKGAVKKLSFMRYDPVLRKHINFKEAKYK